MTALVLLLLVPAGAAIVLGFVPGGVVAALINVAASAATFAISCTLLADRPAPTELWLVDDFNAYLIVLTTFVMTTTAVFSSGYMGHEVEAGHLTRGALRIYHALYQALNAAMLLAMVANNIGLLWVAIEAATLITVIMVSLYRTRESIEAAWKYFILGSVGIALALFGTVLVYLAAQPVIGAGIEAMAWTQLHASARGFSPAVLDLAFVFLLVGYGTKIGLAPVHAWLPDAHAEGPTPISAVLSGLLLNVALYALLRFKMVLAASDAAATPGPLMIALGLGSLLFGGLMLYRRRDLKRFFAYSSIEHMGIITFAFGLGGAFANVAGLLHMAAHSLIKSSIFFAVGRIGQLKGTRQIASLSGITASHPVLGWGLVLAVVAIAGAPPFGIFAAEFLLVSTVFPRAPALAVPFALGLLIGLGALVLRLQHVAFGAVTASTSTKARATTVVPLYVHLGFALIAGLWLPATLAAWFGAVARMLG
jgi:hydrogenase-4 component F